MNLIELLIFLLLCAGLGFLGRVFFPRWGWFVGAIPAGAVLIVMLFATIRQELRKWPVHSNR